MERGLLLAIVIMVFMVWLTATLVYWLFKGTQTVLAATTMVLVLSYSKNNSTKRYFERMLATR